MRGHDENLVLCGSNGYERKYYFNEEFRGLPEVIQKELQVMCVWFTEECGGILTMEFEEDGTLEFRHTTSEYDGYYDEIGVDLKIKQFRRERRELLEALELYFKVFYLGETPDEAWLTGESRAAAEETAEEETDADETEADETAVKTGQEDDREVDEDTAE